MMKRYLFGIIIFIASIMFVSCGGAPVSSSSSLPDAESTSEPPVDVSLPAETPQVTVYTPSEEELRAVDYIEKGPARYRIEANEYVGESKAGVEYSEWTIYFNEYDGLGILRGGPWAEIAESGRIYTLWFGRSSTTPDEELAARTYIPKDTAIQMALDALEKEGITFDWDIYTTSALMWERDGVVWWGVTIEPRKDLPQPEPEEIVTSEGTKLIPPPIPIHYHTFDVSFNAETGEVLDWIHCT